MNTTQASEIIVDNLTLKTLQKIVKHLQETGEPDADLQRAEKILKNHFYNIIANRFDTAISPAEKELQKRLKRIVPGDQQGTEPEEPANEMRGIYSDGFLQGYITAVSDIERFFNLLEQEPGDPTEVF